MESTVNDLTTNGGIDRRKLLGSGAAAIVAPAVLSVIPANAQSRGIKIGYVSPRTGPLAAFGEADNFVLDQVRKIVGPGIVNNGRIYPLEIVVKDSQSNASRGSEVTSELILRDKVDLVVASGAPDTTNPVADQSEVNETPCITSVCPWQPYFFGRNGNPSKPFKWTYHFFWGLEDVIASYLSMWNGAQTNKVIGGLFPNDADGNAWGDAKLGFPPALAKAGYKLVDPGRYQLMNSDFSSQISCVQVRGLRNHHRQHDSARLLHLLGPMRPAGVPPEDRDNRQGACCFRPSFNHSVHGRGALDGNLVEPEPSVQIGSQRPDCTRAVRRL